MTVTLPPVYAKSAFYCRSIDAL